MRFYFLSLMLVLFCCSSNAQTEIHNTMFMFNKLIYNPAYAGSKDISSINAYYRNQWTSIDGAPKVYGVTFDAAVGDRNKEFKDIGIGVSFNNEQIGVESKQNITAFYAFRIKMKNESVLSFGLSGGGQLYSTSYNQLNPLQQNDPNLVKDVKTAFLPNFGGGFFWEGENYYLGAAIPNIIQNYYDKNEKQIHNNKARQVRGYYLNGGCLFHAGETIDFLPQVMLRYAGNGTYQLPINGDLNVSMIISNRFLLGATYRTDNSFEGILRVQVSRNISIGYSYDYLVSALSGYNNGAHELMFGFDFLKKDNEYDKVHFVKPF